MNLAYGHGTIALNLWPEIPFKILQTKAVKPLPDPEKTLLEKLRKPIACLPLQEKMKAGETVCLLVNDSTRLARSEIFLPILVEELLRTGIRQEDIFIIFTNGTHRSLGQDEMKNLVGSAVASKIRMYNHDSRNSEELVYLGKTSFNTPVYINRKVMEADRRILTGSVVHHFFAGFGGGRKALVPGVAGWDTIEHNHSLMLDDRAVSGRLDGNPVHEDLLEAARMVGGDFLLNTVLDQNNDILGIYAGDMIEAHLAACSMAELVNGVELEELADVVIASCGGHPKDINVYQAHKTLDNAMKALKHGGHLILAARCSEGVGSEPYEQWAAEFRTLPEMETALRRNFALGGHKAYTVGRLLQRGKVYLVSDLDPRKASLLGFIPASSLEEAVTEVYEKRRDLLTYVIPRGSIVVPRYERSF